MKLATQLKTWGGRREGAGRKPKGRKPGVSHLRRKPFPARHPVHVTLRALAGVGDLRGPRRRRAIEAALREARERSGMRIVHFSIQGSQLHLLVEAAGANSLARGMQGLAIRLARSLNRSAGRSGKVFADRYHARVLFNRREVADALRHLLGTFRPRSRKDVAPQGADPRSPARWLLPAPQDDAPVVAPRTSLLRRARDG